MEQSKIQMLDISGAEWLADFARELILAGNPAFDFEQRHPYRMESTLAILCEEGCADGAVNLEPYHLEKGGFLIVLPGHIMESYSASSDFKGTHIFMSPHFLESLRIADSYPYYASIERRPYMQLEPEIFEALQHYVLMVRAIIRSSNEFPGAGEALRHLTLAFFQMVGWSLHRKNAETSAQSRESETTQKFLSLVRGAYRQHRDVEYYAAEINMTAKYLSAVIKRATGKPALRWIDDYVILEAKAMLSSAEGSIKQTAFALGFESPSFFGQYFKRITGLTPGQYRNQVR